MNSNVNLSSPQLFDQPLISFQWLGVSLPKYVLKQLVPKYVVGYRGPCSLDFAIPEMHADERLRFRRKLLSVDYRENNLEHGWCITGQAWLQLSTDENAFEDTIFKIYPIDYSVPTYDDILLHLQKQQIHK